MFDGIQGNDGIKQQLTQIVKSNKISHSYLFIGGQDSNEKMIIKEFAKMLLCLDENKYCNKCKSCIEFDSGNNPDFMQIEPDGNSIKIGQIRELQKKIIETPITSSKKVYIINNADLMTTEAQNCLLKTLEEPPEYAVLILMGTLEANFLNTIKSRCIILKFQDISIMNVEELKNKDQLHGFIYNMIDTLEQTDLIDLINSAEIIYKSQDEKFEILDYMNIVAFNKAKQNIKFANLIDIIEDTKKRLKANSNYNMCIDNMLFNIWEEMH